MLHSTQMPEPSLPLLMCMCGDAAECVMQHIEDVSRYFLLFLSWLIQVALDGATP